MPDSDPQGSASSSPQSRESSPSTSAVASTHLTAADLISDRALAKGDQDDFGHGAIAARLADVITESETPLSVALFGAWGAGKSSVFELLRRDLDARPDKFALIRYDAWKFGGEGLQRNFISHAANELGYKERDFAGKLDKQNREFHRGLYEKQRRADVDFQELDWRHWAPAVTFMLTFLAFVALFSLVAGGVSVFTREDFFGQIADTLPKFLASAGIAGAVVTVAKGVLDGATVDVEQSQPAATEEFARVFRGLRDRASGDGYKRLVFFIDELDRCAPEDVVKTLAALRTFLDLRDCVFVVAADREVLEKALVELPQATPLDEENPYYSSASSFFDKVFHHGFTLPPLRARRLTRFARDLVSTKEGLWRELRSSPTAEGRLLDRVIYALIPSHIRSPRRVKVLLNNFATNVRIAESRGVVWLDRAPEIAKLTVLQTEFPLLAADLSIEPRLPGYLLSPPLNPSDRVKRLLSQHGGAYRTTDDAGVETITSSPPALTDPSIVASTDDAARDKKDIDGLARAEHRLLRRYLERALASGIVDPGRDLLYLEPVGAAVGLDDAALGELIETEAPDRPQMVVAALADRDLDDQKAAVRVLADMAEQEFGDERRNVVTALMRSVALLDDHVTEVGAAVIAALKSFQQEQVLDDGHLAGALNLAVRFDSADGAGLTDELFDDDRLFDVDTRVAEVASLYGHIPARHREFVGTKVGQWLADGHIEVLTGPLSSLDSESAEELLRSPAVSTALDEFLAGSTADEAEVAAQALYGAVDTRDDGAAELRAVLQGLLLQGEVEDIYGVILEHAERVMDTLDADHAAADALLALAWAPAEDWPFWTPYVGAPTDNVELDSRYGREALLAVFGRVVQDSDVDVERAVETLNAVAAHAADGDEQQTTKLLNSVEEALAAGPTWWAADGLAPRQRLHRAAEAMMASDTTLAIALEQALLADVSKVFDAVTLNNSLPGGAQKKVIGRPDALLGLKVLGSALSPASSLAVVKRLSEVGATGDESYDIALLDARLALTRAANVAGSPAALTFVPSDEVVEVAALRTSDALRTVAAWLNMNPPVSEAVSVLAALDKLTGEPLRQALDGWAANLTDDLRTIAVSKLMDTDADRPDWLQTIATHGLDDAMLVAQLGEQLAAATRSEDRGEAVARIVALRPGDSKANREVAELVLRLLSSGTYVDFKNALKLAEALGPASQHRSTDRLRSAFKAAAELHGGIPKGPVMTLEHAGINLPQKSFSDKALDFLKGRQRR